MAGLKEAVAQDFEAALEAFRKDSFDNMNIFANRMMSNAIFGEDSKIFLPGFLLKDVSFTFGVLKTRKVAAAYSTAKSHGFTFIDKLKRLLPSGDEAQMWKEFHDYNNNIRKFEMDDFEESSYKDNVDFTKSSFEWLISYLKSNENILFDSNNFLLKSVLNEMTRLFRVHSGTISETIIMALIEALDRNYDYICRIHGEPNTRLIDNERVKTEILPSVGQIEKIYKEGTKISEADTLLWTLVRKWRELFLGYMELLPPGLALRKGIELPEELKKKLSESITKTLEKEV